MSLYQEQFVTVKPSLKQATQALEYRITALLKEYRAECATLNIHHRKSKHPQVTLELPPVIPVLIDIRAGHNLKRNLTWLYKQNYRKERALCLDFIGENGWPVE